MTAKDRAGDLAFGAAGRGSSGVAWMGVAAGGVVCAAALLAGCGGSHGARSERGADGASPSAMAGPEGGPVGFKWRAEDAREPNQPIDLSVPERAVWSTVSPTIIDTRLFPVQVQDVRATERDMRMKDNLPPHQRPVKPRVEGVYDAQDAGEMLADRRAVPGELFPGISQTPWTPPDITLAVGPDHIVSTVNMAVAFYDKSGNLQFQSNLDSTGNPGFFEVVGASTFTFDPKCFYDHETGRFVIVALEVYGSTQAWIDIAVSDDSDPNGVWYKYRTNAVIAGTGAQTYWVDYPGFGFDGDAYYVTGNLFGLNQSGFGGTLFRTYPKGPMLAGQPVQFSDIRDPGASSVQVAQVYGNNAAPFFISDQSNTQLRVQAIRNPLTAPTLSTALVNITGFSYPSGGAPNPGGTVDVLDGRIMNASWRNGKLLAAHGVSSGGKTVSRWYEIATNSWPTSGSPTLAQLGNISLPGTLHSFFPAIHANRHGDVGVVMAGANASTVPSVYVTGRRVSDPANAMGASTLVATGTAGANGRWGDYFDITTDPNDDATFWYIGQYQTPAGWQSFIGSFVITCAANVNGDLTLDVLDFLDYLDAFGACEGEVAPCSSGGVSADFNADGLIDILDFLDFLDAFAGGC